MLNLGIIVGSTRPGRAGLSIARWFEGIAVAHEAFKVDFIDLMELALPMMDEPKHPRLRDYTHQHTRDWSARIEPLDALVFVTPEYNYSFPASLKNALDYLMVEWAEKPAGIVSYGGVSGGLRAAEKLKMVLTPLNIMPINLGVPIFMFPEFRDAAGTFTGNEAHGRSAAAMLAALARWGEGLKAMRDGENKL